MRRTLALVCGAIVLAGSCAANAAPRSCFVVHADPHEATDSAFASLAQLVALADEYRVLLTLLFTAQWAEMILADPAKVTAVEGILAHGHEVGAHHHAYWATLDQAAQWDGYTNTSFEKLDAKDRVRFRGSMADYWRLLQALPGDCLTGCMGLGEQDAADWICDLRYSTFGHALGDAVSEPTTITVHGCSAIQIRHALLVEPEPGELTDVYAQTGDGVLFAVVAHVSDYVERPAAVERWFQFLAAEDPEGGRRATVAKAVQGWADR